jgi:hypothetical protein
MKTDMNIFTRIFCWIGGGHISVLQEMPTERNRFFGYGTVIFMTAVFATISSGYAFSFIMGGQFNWFIAIPAAMWGCFIFILDRFFVVSISNSGTFWRKLLNASPRLVLALFIGVIISKPLEYKVCEQEIKKQLSVTCEEEADDEDKRYSIRMDSLNAMRQMQIEQLPGSGHIIKKNQGDIAIWTEQLKEKEEAVRIQRDTLQAEVSGHGGSYRRGVAGVAAVKLAELIKVESDRNELSNRINTANNEIKQLMYQLKGVIDSTITPAYERNSKKYAQDRDSMKSTLRNNFRPSILNQEIALSQIQSAWDFENNRKKYPGADWAVLFITALFVLIEMAPMILKLLGKAGPYESRIAQIESTYSTDNRLRRSLDIEEYKSNRGLVQQLARSQRQIIEKALRAWYKEHKQKAKDPEFYNTLLTENRESDNH